MSHDDLLSLCSDINSWADFIRRYPMDGYALFSSVSHDGLVDEFMFGRADVAGAFLHLAGADLNGPIHLYVNPDTSSVKLFSRHLLPEEKRSIGFFLRSDPPTE